ncbi:MAG: polymerase sigma-70 factor, subfamily [Blastocatellia bacterium]
MSEETNLKNIGNALHLRLLSGNDLLVTAEIAEKFLSPLIRALRRRLNRLNTDEHLIATAAEDALLAYFKNPRKYDPSKLSLLKYLCMDAYWNVIDKLRKPEKTVELDPSNPEHIAKEVSEDDPEAQLLEDEAMWLGEKSPITQRMLAVISDPTDRELVRLMMDGEKETESYAQILRIQAVSPEEKATIVKRHKDRLKKKLSRALKPWAPKKHE